MYKNKRAQLTYQVLTSVAAYVVRYMPRCSMNIYKTYYIKRQAPIKSLHFWFWSVSGLKMSIWSLQCYGGVMLYTWQMLSGNLNSEFKFIFWPQDWGEQKAPMFSACGVFFWESLHEFPSRKSNLLHFARFNFQHRLENQSFQLPLNAAEQQQLFEEVRDRPKLKTSFINYVTAVTYWDVNNFFGL